MNLLSWLDIERVLASETQNFTKLPEGISSIRTYSDAIEIDTVGEDSSPAYELLKNTFGDHWRQEGSNAQVFLSYSSDSAIDVIINQNSELDSRSAKPLWKDLGYADENPILPKAPEPFSGKIRIVAFHSFKGGVGRTTSLLTWLMAVIKESHKSGSSKPPRVLLVDADLEAPGLTYLFKPVDRPEVSWVQLLEATHYPPVDSQKVIRYFSDEVKRFTKHVLGGEVCLLPAFSASDHMDMSQLIDISVRPEHLARGLDQPWKCTDILQKLGKSLDADLVLIDLRAGLSELSSPFLFDPRLERFLVTTLSEQAVQGTEFILQKMSALASTAQWQEQYGGDTLAPRVVATFITDEFRKTDRYFSGIEQLKKAYDLTKDYENENAADSLEIIEGEFSSAMLHLGDWDNALRVIEKNNPLLEEAEKWAKNFLLSSLFSEPTKNKQKVTSDQAQKLSDLSDKLVFAEKGKSDRLLLTDPLRELAQRHISKLPLVVSIGAKGAGKTFNYIQLCRRKNWLTFLKEAHVSLSNDDEITLNKTFILPHIHSENVEGDAFSAVNDARDHFHKNTGSQSEFSNSHFDDQLTKALAKGDTDWSRFWERSIIELHGADPSKVTNFVSLTKWLQEKAVRTITIFDGIEDHFKTVNSDKAQASALKALIKIPNRLQEIRNCPMGVIILIREDYIEAVVPQNLGQFRSRYEPYQLVWDADAFLRLTYWACQQAGLDFADTPVEKMTSSEISAKLHKLWGLKLGKPTSREAYTVRWVYAALCDLKGRLQARDIIRFLKFSSLETSKSTSMTSDRVLSPMAMRKAMTACSEGKVDEAKKEFAVLGDWIKTLSDVDPKHKQIPFSISDVGLKSEQLERLVEFGIIYEDKRKNESKRYYLPETYRKGLNFTMAGGGRPRVQAMLKESLGRLPVDI